MLEKKYERLIDQRNFKLWEELENNYNIQLQISPEPNYIVNIRPDLITIYVEEDNLNPASFTHELLHIYVKDKGVLIADEYTDRVFGTIMLNLVFNKNLLDFIGNCLEHYVMYPKYLELGYEAHKFNSDYSVEKLTMEEARRIKDNYRVNGGYNVKAVEFFIGKFFGLKACNNSSYNYHRALRVLESTDKKLFNLLCEFWNDWTTFNMNDPEDSYSDILDYHFEDLLSWQDGKKFN